MPSNRSPETYILFHLYYRLSSVRSITSLSIHNSIKQIYIKEKKSKLIHISKWLLYVFVVNVKKYRCQVIIDFVVWNVKAKWQRIIKKVSIFFAFSIQPHFNEFRNPVGNLVNQFHLCPWLNNKKAAFCIQLKSITITVSISSLNGGFSRRFRREINKKKKRHKQWIWNDSMVV